MKRVVSILSLWALLALVSPAFAQPVDEPPKGTGGISFKADEPIPADAPPLQKCEAQNERLAEHIRIDDVGKPYLIAGYLAFFLILVAFSASAALRQRKLETEMAELRARLAKLQEGP